MDYDLNYLPYELLLHTTTFTPWPRCALALLRMCCREWHTSLVSQDPVPQHVDWALYALLVFRGRGTVPRVFANYYAPQGWDGRRFDSDIVEHDRADILEQVWRTRLLLLNYNFVIWGACRVGSLRVLNWVVQRKKSAVVIAHTPNVVAEWQEEATRHNQKEVLEWMHAHGFARNNDLPGRAARSGHFELMIWLIRDCCYLSYDKETLLSIARTQKHAEAIVFLETLP